MKVALVQLPVWWTIDPPLGLAQMAGCALQQGHEINVFDLNIVLWKNRTPQYQNMWIWEQFHFWNNPAVVEGFFKDNRALIDNYVEDVLRTDARAICFSVALGAQLATLEFARRIKARDPKRIVVVGGQYFFKGEKAGEMLQDPAIDVVIQGMADQVFPRLLADLEIGRDLGGVPGLVFRRNGNVVDTGQARPLRSLDSVPFADFTRFPMELYEDQNRIPISASRGCVWFCRFCSTREFWSMYSYMSGERIYAEVCHHRRLFPQRYHVEFYDITANGKPECLSKFSDLIVENEQWTGGWKEFKWKINAIIRPEMTAELLGKMARANCQDIIYGVESGSPRVLKKMNKHYNVAIAERVLRDTHGAGIKAIGNFMFGFPGETEEDFQMTLDFLQRNHASFDRVYASATFTSLEEHSYLTKNQEEFDIAPQEDKHHSLYWETRDGTNNYLVRLDRYNRFRELAVKLGIDAYKGVNGALALDHVLNTAHYYLYDDRPMESLRHYLEYFRLDHENEAVRAQTMPFWKSARLLRTALKCLEKANETLGQAADKQDLARRVQEIGAASDSKSLHQALLQGSGHPGVRWALQALHRLKKIDFYSTELKFEPSSGFVVQWGKDRLSDLSESGKIISDFLIQLRGTLAAQVPVDEPQR